MKLAPFRHLATHLVGMAAGGALAYLTITPSPPPDVPPPPKHRSTTLAAKFSPTVTLELERLLKDLDDEEAERTKDPSIHELAEQVIIRQAQQERERHTELARLRAFSQNFAAAGDLGPLLTDAIVADDPDATRAIFLEWHRRDPKAAFDALAIRGDWLQSFDQVLALAVPDAQIIAQAARDDRPADFRKHLLNQLGRKLGESDQLAAIGPILDALAPDQQYQFLDAFALTWTPDHGREAARFIGLEMSPAHQRLFLESIETAFFPAIRIVWTREFSEALFQFDLNVPPERYQSLVRQSKRAALAPPDLFGFPALEGDAPNGLDPGLDSAEAFEAMHGPLGRQLRHHRDYPELFLNGAVTLDEIAGEMQSRIPGADAHPEALHRALFIQLATHDPARAITWAHPKIAPRHLDRDIGSIYDGLVRTGARHSLQDPRTRRLAEHVALLQPRRITGAESEMIAKAILRMFATWSQFAPEEAAPALARIPPHHPIWNFRAPETAGP